MMKDLWAEALTQAFCGQLWGDATHLLGVRPGSVPRVRISLSGLGPRAVWPHPPRFTPHLLSNSVFLLCVFCCMWESNMGVEKKVLGQIMQYGWKCFPVQIWHKNKLLWERAVGACCSLIC